MTRIGYNSTQWIAEDGRHLLERYLVLDEICRSLSRIPLELQGQPSLYLRADDWISAPHGRIINFTGTGRSRITPSDVSVLAGLILPDAAVLTSFEVPSSYMP